MSLHDLHFFVTDILKCFAVLNFSNGKKKFLWYLSDEITRCFIVLKQISFPVKINGSRNSCWDFDSRNQRQFMGINRKFRQ